MCLTQSGLSEAGQQRAHNRTCGFFCQSLFNGPLEPVLADKSVFVLVSEDLEERAVGGNKKRIQIQTVPTRSCKVYGTGCVGGNVMRFLS